MPRKIRDERLDTRAARLRLAVRREPYWRGIQEGRALGYRRLSAKAGTWIARHQGKASGRTYRALGSADDHAEADGAGTLTFAQAQTAALAWFAELGRAGGKVATPVTVGDALDAYLAKYEAGGGRSLADTRRAVEAHIRPALGSKLVADLTPKLLRDWHRALALTPARMRAGPKTEKRCTRAAVDPDAKRARRATANRVLTVLRAALNHAYSEGHVASDDAWRRVQPFSKVDAPRIRYLTDDEARRLLNACPSDLRELVTAALLTGCRYGELATLRPADVDLAAGVLTASGKVGARTVVLTNEAGRFFGQAMAGRPAGAALLTRSDGEPWGKSHQSRPLRAACAAAKIAPAVSFHILRHTHASRLAMRGVPMAVVAAQLGHANLTMTTKHYAHLSPGYVADTVRQAFGEFGIVPDTNIAVLRTDR
jgi:integrase